MTVYDFLRELHHDGIKLWLNNDRLRYRAPGGALSQERLEAIKASRDEIVRLLREVQVETAEASPARPGRLPLSFAQKRLWFLDHVQGPNTTYNTGAAFTLQGSLSAPALEIALAALAERHESLRTRFVLPEGAEEPVQVIEPSATLSLDLRDVRPENVPALVRAHHEAPFQLDRGPLLRFLLLRLGPEEHVLSVVIHHIISDGWSISVLTQDMQALYTAALEGRRAALTPLRFQYADYALRQQQQDSLPHKAYWTELLAGYFAPLALGESGSHKRLGRAGLLQHRVPVEVSRKLAGLGLAHEASLFMVLLAGVAIAAAKPGMISASGRPQPAATTSILSR